MKLILFYCLTIFIGVSLFLSINSYGISLFGEQSITSSTAGGFHFSILGQVLLALVTVIPIARACGFLVGNLIAETFYNVGDYGNSDNFYDWTDLDFNRETCQIIIVSTFLILTN